MLLPLACCCCCCSSHWKYGQILSPTDEQGDSRSWIETANIKKEHQKLYHAKAAAAYLMRAPQICLSYIWTMYHRHTWGAYWYCREENGPRTIVGGQYKQNILNIGPPKPMNSILPDKFTTFLGNCFLLRGFACTSCVWHGRGLITALAVKITKVLSCKIQQVFWISLSLKFGHIRMHR